MPHTMDGEELKVGDRILLPCIIKAIHLTEDYCNLDLESVKPMYPGERPLKLSANSKQVKKSK